MTTYLANLILPQNLCMTLVVLGLVLGLLRLRRTGACLAVFGLAWLLAWSLPITSLWLGGSLEARYPHLPAAQLPAADAIVVLGGNTANGRANWFLPYDKETAIVRVDTAVKLYQAGRAPKVVLSGGALEGDISEARGMAFLMKQQGVPERALLLENSSRTTYENAILTEEELEEHGFRKILLVTSALHMPRAMAAFSKQGVSAIPASTPPQIVLPPDGSVSPWIPHQRTLDASRSIIKEYAGLLVYWLRGWV
ncbi:YdcF family protein [Bordetella petrii]|uniref:YdcF family protein n=1 Tax=Bordetella petrii TaxID=94624 RepID=UPI001E4224F6|nr:YdcF family protein [Bordetella petrii]MCD0502059.1 YdcF family protein [Bordetella petrii]